MYDTHSREQKVRLLKSKRFSLFHASISQKQIIEHFSPDFAFWYYARFPLDFPLSFWLYVMSGEKRKNGSRECDDKIYTCILSESIKKPSLPLMISPKNKIFLPLKIPSPHETPQISNSATNHYVRYEKNVRVLVSHFVFRWYWLYHIPRIGRISAIKLSWQVTLCTIHFDAFCARF